MNLPETLNDTQKITEVFKVNFLNDKTNYFINFT